MQNLRVHDKEFEPYLSAADIDDRIQLMAAAINKDKVDKRPWFNVI